LPWAEVTCATILKTASLVGLLLGLSNLAIWLIPSTQAVALWSGFMVMRVNSAIGTIAASISLLTWHLARQRRGRERVASALGFVVALIGALTSIEYFAGVNLRVDELFAPGTFAGDHARSFVVAPGRMSLNAALAFFFLGLALAGLDWTVSLKKDRPIFLAPVFALFAGMPAACGLVGYLLATREFTGLLRSTNILLHTALVLFLLSAGVLAARPHRTPVSEVFSTGATGVLLRWLLLGSTTLLLALAWGIAKGRDAGLVGDSEGTALMLYGGLILLFVLIVAAGRAVARQEESARDATEALREGQERFRALADNISQLAWMTDETGSIIWFNRRWLEYTGRTLEEMRGGGWLRLVPPAHAGDVLEKLQVCFHRGEDWEDLFPLRGKDGAYRWFLSHARPIRDAEGQVTRWFGTHTDVTEQRDLTQQLARAKEEAETISRALAAAAGRFRFLAEAVSLQVWTARPNGELDFANQEVAHYFGGSVEHDFLGNAWLQYIHEDDLPLAMRGWQEAVASGERYETEFRFRRNDGAFRWFLVRAQAMSDDGRIVSWFGTNTDIHDLKTAQREAVAASRAKDDFLAALSHELRTPLTPVLLSAHSLRDDPRVPEDIRSELAMIERNIALEGRLIDDLLDLTRITRGKLPLRMELCDAHSLLGHSLEIIRDEAQGKGVTVSLDLRAARSGVVGDPARLQQVFWNLLRNAVKFTPAGGRIDIRTYDFETSGRLVLEVTDTGFGFEPDFSDRLFLPFEQEAREGHHRFGGLGLGLAIARAIVELHGGTIHATSAGPGLGATFRVELPSALESPSGLVALPPSADTPEIVAAPMRILLVEDHPATVAVLARLLRKFGHEVIATSTVAAALAANEEGTFDAVISDLGLPDGSGLDLFRKLRTKNPALRGIALSGYGMEEDMVRTREAGFSFHLVKPVDFDELARVIRDLARQAEGATAAVEAPTANA
jgi:PAS domain S-box-containing protein